MLVNSQVIRNLVGLEPGSTLWFGILPVSAGVFGVGLGLAMAVVVSLATRGGD
jgi:cation/acetate symporter